MTPRRGARGHRNLPALPPKTPQPSILAASKTARRKPGRPRLSAEEKTRRGTLRPSRERSRAPRSTAVARVSPAASRDYVTLADNYAHDVVAGQIVAGQWTIKACRRYLHMRAQARTGQAPYAWSAAHANDVCTFVEQLPHVEGSWGADTIVLQPWQAWMLAAIYGFRRPDGGRVVTTVFFQVARKSAKSTLVAACALYHLACEQEPGAQVILGASTGDQARIVFSIMQRMVRRSRGLREQGLQALAHAVVCDNAHGGSAKPINAKSSTQDGLNPSFISLDESHAQDFTLHDVLKSAQGARANPLFMAPTTAGYSMTSVGYALRTTAQKILDGVVDSDHTFVVLYELDEADDWRDEAVWVKSAPMLGITPTLDYVRRYRDDAIATPGMQGEFETKIGNRWLHAASNWLSMASWDGCADPSLCLDDFAGEPCCLGADLAQKDDLAALAVAFVRDEVVYGFVRFYLPRLVVESRSRAVPAYRQWVEQGVLTVTEGNTLDERVVEADVRAWCDRFDVRAITFDQFGSAGIMTRLASDGFPAVLTPKNATTFSGPARDLEMRVRAQRFQHDGNPVLRWNASNCCVTRRVDDSILPKKESPDSPNKIDGIDALLLAMGAAERTLAAGVVRSVYDDPAYDVFVV